MPLMTIRPPPSSISMRPAARSDLLSALCASTTSSEIVTGTKTGTSSPLLPRLPTGRPAAFRHACRPADPPPSATPADRQTRRLPPLVQEPAINTIPARDPRNVHTGLGTCQQYLVFLFRQPVPSPTLTSDHFNPAVAVLVPGFSLALSMALSFSSSIKSALPNQEADSQVSTETRKGGVFVALTSISSTIHRLKGNRKYSQTARAMICGGKPWFL
ncbi:hypothetical protein ACVIKO_000289 [Rhizobium ruizarguesonis]